MTTVLRITRHPCESGRAEALRAAFGADVRIVDRNVPFGDDPVRAVKNLMDEFGDVVAVEMVAPIPVFARVLSARRELGDVLFLRAEFARGEDGRAKVIGTDQGGRDVFAFSHYDVVERVEVKTRLLLPK